MKKTQKESSKRVKVGYCDPAQVFTQTDIHLPGGDNNYDLTKAFYNVRYDDDGNDSNNSFYRNAGAVQFFNKGDNSKIGKAYGSISKPISVKEELSSYGHSERIGMRDSLDGYIKKYHPNNGEIQAPSQLARSKKAPEIDVFTQLLKHATEYRKLLKQQEVVVKMWSERKPCDYDSEGGGGHCADFLDSVVTRYWPIEQYI